MCLLIRCVGYINGFREITVAVIARLRLRLLYRLSTTQLISGRYPLRLQHRPQLLLLDS